MDIEYHYQTAAIIRHAHFESSGRCREGDQACTECSHIMYAAAGIKTITSQVIYWSYKWSSTAWCQLRSVDEPQNNRC